MRVLYLNDRECDILVTFMANIQAYLYGRHLGIPEEPLRAWLEPCEGGYTLTLMEDEFRFILSFLLHPPTLIEEGVQFNTKGSELLTPLFSRCIEEVV